MKMTTATIQIVDLEIHCIIGALPSERKTPQTIYIDLSLNTDCAEAIKTDDLSNAIDYRDLAALCERLAIEKKYCLIETFASECLDALLSRWPISWASIRVKKPNAISSARFAIVEMERLAK